MSKKSFLTALCAVSLCAILLFSGTNLSEGIRRGLFLCSYSVIPALFPFMALSVFICRSSAAEFFSKLFRPITKLLKIPENCGGILLAAAIGGYPAAAKCINDSVCGGFLDRKTASIMLCFCVNAGPPFLISAVGIGVFGSIRTGFLLFAAQFLSSAIIAVLLSCFSKKPETCREHYSTIYRSNSALIVESIISAAESCFRMCAFIVIACGILEISFGGAVFGFAENKPLLKAIFSGFFEITAGVFSCAEIEGLASVIAAMESDTIDATAVYAAGNVFSSAIVLGGSADMDRLPGHLPRTSPAENEYLGCALFSGPRMTGTLTGEETGLLMLITGQAQRRSTFIGNAFYRTNLPTRVRRRIDPDGTLSVHIAMSLEHAAGEAAMTSEEIAARIERDAVNVLLRLRAASCDAAGFGRIAIRESIDIPTWEARNWPDEYDRLGVRVSAEVTVH